MTRTKWVGAGLVIASLVLGCRQSRQYSGGGDGGITPPMIGAMAPGSGSVDHELADSPAQVIVQQQ